MNIYGYKEIRKLSADALRSLCIRNNWYTMGDNKEYEYLLSMCDNENITTDNIVEIATDIMEHSIDKSIRPFTSYAFEVARICITFIEEA